MPNHETPSYNQINEQQKDGLSATVLTGRSNGRVETAVYAGKIGDKYYVQLNEVDKDGQPKYRSISEYDLSDKGQAALAEELAADREQLSEESEKLVTVVKTIGHEATDSALTEIEVSAGRPRVELRAEDIERSVSELGRTLDPRLEAIFRGVKTTPAERRAALDPNNGDHEKREALENLLRITIDQIGGEGKLPERVQRNDLGDLKSVADQKLGYQDAKYPPRDYAAKVALAILDGSFKGDPRKRDYADLPANDPRNGQHRQAALMALDRLMSEKKVAREDTEATSEVIQQARKIVSELIDSREITDVKTMIHRDGVAPDEAIGVVDRFNSAIDDVRRRISRLNPENNDDDRVLMQTREQLTVPAHIAGDAYNELLRWRHFVEEQGDSPGIRRIYEEATHDLMRAITELNQNNR